MPILTTFIQHNIESPNQGNYARKRNKRHLKWKGRSKAGRILYRENPKDSTKKFFMNAGKLQDSIVQFNSVAQSCPTLSDPMD